MKKLILLTILIVAICAASYPVFQTVQQMVYKSGSIITLRPQGTGTPVDSLYNRAQTRALIPSVPTGLQDSLTKKANKDFTNVASNAIAISKVNATTVGKAFMGLTNPSAITFPRVNADNSVDALNASAFRTAIGAGTGNGTITGSTLPGVFALGNGTTSIGSSIASQSGSVFSITGSLNATGSLTGHGADLRSQTGGTVGIGLEVGFDYSIPSNPKTLLISNGQGSIAGGLEIRQTGGSGTITSAYWNPSGLFNAYYGLSTTSITASSGITGNGLVSNNTSGYSLTINGSSGGVSAMEMKVSGTTNGFIGVANGSGTLITGAATGEGLWRTANKRILFSTDNGTTANFIFDASGNFTAAANVSSYSDSTLKDNIKPLDDVSSSLKNIVPSTFNWKSTGRIDIGFIAQNIEKYYPEFVLSDNNGIKSIDYSRLTVPLLKGWQEHSDSLIILYLWNGVLTLIIIIGLTYLISKKS